MSEAEDREEEYEGRKAAEGEAYEAYEGPSLMQLCDDAGMSAQVFVEQCAVAMVSVAQNYGSVDEEGIRIDLGTDKGKWVVSAFKLTEVEEATDELLDEAPEIH